MHYIGIVYLIVPSLYSGLYVLSGFVTQAENVFEYFSDGVKSQYADKSGTVGA